MSVVIDHLVLAVPDLAEGVDWFAEVSGVRPIAGGAHEGRGTHNALVSLGDSYLELIAPDPDQPDPPQPRPFGVSDVTTPTLVTFAVRPAPGGTIETVVAGARSAQFDPGDPQSMSRMQPDGSRLEWKLTFPLAGLHGVVPFVIDWEDTQNPAETTPQGLGLNDLMVHHPNASEVGAAHRALGLALPVMERPTPAIRASLSTPGGSLLLR